MGSMLVSAVLPTIEEPAAGERITFWAALTGAGLPGIGGNGTGVSMTGRAVGLGASTAGGEIALVEGVGKIGPALWPAGVIC